MEAEKVINLIEEIEKPVKVGAYSEYSIKKKSRSSKGRTILNIASGINRSKVDTIYNDFEKLRVKTVDNIKRNVKVFVTVK